MNVLKKKGIMEKVKIEKTNESKVYEKITFKGLTVNDKVTFNDKEPVVVLINIFNPILKLDNCTWLEEM